MDFGVSDVACYPTRRRQRPDVNQAKPQPMIVTVMTEIRIRDPWNMKQEC